MRIHGKLLRIFKENENLAHFLNSKAQDFYTREPRDLAYFLTFLFFRAKKNNRSRKEGEPQRKYPLAAWHLCAFA